MAKNQFPCESCGAVLHYQPGTQALVCSHCGHENSIAESQQKIEEIDFHALLDQSQKPQEIEQSVTVHCDGCGAEFTPAAHVHAAACAFCGSTVVSEPHTHEQLKPGSLLPFKLSESDAQTAFCRMAARFVVCSG